MPGAAVLGPDSVSPTYQRATARSSLINYRGERRSCLADRSGKIEEGGLVLVAAGVAGESA